MNVAVTADDIPAFLDRRPFVWSFSALAAFKNCPYRFYRQYIVRDQPYLETPERKRGNDIHSAMERRIASRQPLPDDMRHWEPFAAPFENKGAFAEVKLGITKEGYPTGFWDNNVWGRGTADVVLIRDDTAYLPDWKHTNKSREEPFELEIMGLLVHAKYPHLKRIKAQYAWLRENRMGVLHDVSDTRRTWDTVCSLVAEIGELRKQNNFAKRKTPLCGWCSIRECENWFEARK